MHFPRLIWVQLAIFLTVSITALLVMALGYLRLPSMLFGIGEFQVTVELPASGGIYPRGNVTYRGTEVGKIREVRLSDTGVQAVLSIDSSFDIPSDLIAEVHSQTAVGEQYIALLPRDGSAEPLKEGSVIPVANTRVPPGIGALLDATNRGLRAIPADNLKTVIDESYNAFGGLGAELSRIVMGATALASDAQESLNEIVNVVDNLPPLLDTQNDTSDAVHSWAANLADVTKSVQEQNQAVQQVLRTTGPATEEVRTLFERIRPTLPIVLANLVSLGEVAVVYRDNLEQLLVLLPQGTQAMQAINIANANTKQDYKGAYLSFNLNLNLPPACTTGFLPAQQRRAPSEVDFPDRPAGEVYCRTPQDSVFGVRGARNYPCVTRPGKRAATVKMCESDQEYAPLNDGFNWKGDPNATLSGQGVPQFAPGETPPPGYPASYPPPALTAVAEYDPATGTYVGPDGQIYSQSNLARGAKGHQTWESMLLPPTGN